MQFKMMNNKGFTLIELLAVLAILITIVAFAVPSVVSSLNKQKSNDLKNRKQYIVNTVELKYDSGTNSIKNKLGSSKASSFALGNCYVSLKWLKDYGFITGNQIADISSTDLTKQGVYRMKPNYTYEYYDKTNLNKCA